LQKTAAAFRIEIASDQRLQRALPRVRIWRAEGLATESHVLVIVGL